MFLTAALAAGQIAPAYADGTTTMTSPYSHNYSNPCPPSTDAVIPVSGTLTIVMHSITTTNGAIRINELDIAPSLTGTGLPSKDTYVVDQYDKFFFDVEPSGTEVDDIVDRFHVVSKGPSPNFTHTMQFHLTINPQGATTATVYDLDDSCTG